MGNKTENTDENRTLVAFKPSNGVTEYQVILDKGADTIWATELQIADIFGRDRTVINRHIENAFKDEELDEATTSAKIAQVRIEGDREIEREVLHYNLDVIISVGYRVKSPLATEFTFSKKLTRKSLPHNRFPHTTALFKALFALLKPAYTTHLPKRGCPRRSVDRCGRKQGCTRW